MPDFCFRLNINLKQRRNIMQQKQFTQIRKLTQDLTFQNFFKKYDKSLKSLLKAFLPLPKGQVIEELTILDPSPFQYSEVEKKSIMDIRLNLSNGDMVNVELQNYNHQSFRERILYYSAKNYAGQPFKGNKYNKLKPCYSLVFTTFCMFPEVEEIYNGFSLRRDKPPHFVFTKDISVMVVELPKFKKRDINNLLDLKEQWCYILRESQNMGTGEIKQLSNLSKEMEVVMSNLQEFSLEEKQRYVQDNLDKRAWERSDLQQEAMEKGMQKGLEQRQQEMILNMLKKGFDHSVIAEVAGVSTDYIKKLQN